MSPASCPNLIRHSGYDEAAWMSAETLPETRVDLYESESFDKKFDDNRAGIIEDIDLSTLKRPNQTQRRVNVDFPIWIIESLDKEARRIGVTGQSIIKIWLAERLQEQTERKTFQRASHT